MGLQHAYSTTNLLSALAATAFTASSGTTANRGYLNDGLMSKLFSDAVVSTYSIAVDLGSAQPVSVAAVLNSNIASSPSAGACTLSIIAADDSAFTVNVVTAKSATTLKAAGGPRGKDHALQFPSVTKRYWKFSWASLGSFTLKIGELWLGALTTPQRYMTYGNGESRDYIVAEFQSRTAESRAHYIAGPVRSVTLPFSDLALSEKDDLVDLVEATKGGASPLLWCRQYGGATSAAATDDEQDGIFGRLQKPSFAWKEMDFGRYDPDEALIIRSMGREVGA